jgi:hypothetical protein
MLRKINILCKRKKALSEMLSYVILISIGITLAVGVFVWLRALANIEPVIDCKQDSSLIIENYSCTSTRLTLVVKNNGFFNLSGFVLTVGNNSAKFPTTSLTATDPQLFNFGAGTYLFNNPLAPDTSTSANFDKDGIIKVARIQPFILDKKNTKIMCANKDIKQEISGCD